MNKTIYILLIIAVILCNACKTNTLTDSTKNLYEFSNIDNKVNSWINRGYYDGASLIIFKDNKLIFENYYGNYTTETEVYVASAGKWVDVAVIASIVDDGLITWSDPVNKYLPEFEDIKGTTTISQLLSHTSGYPDYQPIGVKPDNYQTLEESVANIVNLPADTLPGTVFKYGGLDMQVAGRIAELVTKKDWETLFQEKIAQPLSMNHTHFVPVDTTQGHNPMLGGGLKTSLHDFANFLEMIDNEGIFREKQVLSKNVIEEMQSDFIQNAKLLQTEYVEQVREEKHKSIYGLGEWREEINSTGKAVLISSPGWAGAYPWIDKTTGTRGIFLTHVNVEKSNQEGFSSLLSSPVLPNMVRDAIHKAELPDSVTKGYITIQNKNFYYEEAGEGEALILIHGHSFDNSEWDPQFLKFAKNFRTIRYDCRGYGRSSMPIEGEQFLHAEDLLTLMNLLKIEKAHIVGLSMGGFIVSDFIALHEDRILTTTAACGDILPVPGPSDPWSEEGIVKRKKEISELKKTGIFRHKKLWCTNLIKNSASKAPSVHKRIWDMIYRWDDWQSFHIEPRLVLGNDAPEILKSKNIKVPVMVLTEKKDSQIPNKLLECIPSAIEGMHSGKSGRILEYGISAYYI